jgi:transcriptional regulator with XRE-family HTH domain
MTLANLADLTHNFINEIENGRKWVSTDTLAKLTAALEAEPYEFFLAKNNKKDIDSLYFEDHLEELKDNFDKMVHDFRGFYLDEISDDEDE